MSDRNHNLRITVSSSTVQHRLPTTGREEHVFVPSREHTLQRANAPSVLEYAESEALDLEYTSRPAPARISDIRVETQRLWESARDIESQSFRDAEVYYNSPDLVPPTPDTDFISEFRSLAAAIDDYENRLRSPNTDMNPEAQALRMFADLTDREILLEEIESRFVPDHLSPDLLMPAPEDVAEYQRITAEISDLEDGLEDFRVSQDRLRDETFTCTAEATTFLEGLPVVPLHDLAEDNRDCNICQEPYATGCESDVVRLPCGHIFGKLCISTWLTKDAGPANSTCPMCRTVLFDVPRQRRVYISTPTSDIIDEFEAAIAMGDDVSDDDDSPQPRPLEWRGVVRFLNDIRHLEFLLSRADEHPGQPISFLESRYGPIDARFVRPAETWWDGERSFAEHVWRLFRIYIERPGPAGDRDGEAAAALAALMGRLYESLREPMRVARTPIVWTESGPPVSFLIDPAAIPLVELALEWLSVIESQNRTRRQVAMT